MKIQSAVSSALLVSMALAGCSSASSNDAFNSLNSVFSQAKKGASTLSNATLPAAAIATSLGAVELLKKLSLDSKGAGISGGQLPGSGSNVVAQGAGNLATNSGSLQAPRFSLASTDGDEDVSNGDDKVAMHVKYTSSTDASGATVSQISSFKGNVQGYDINAQGTFTYAPSSTGGVPAVSASMTGSVTYKDTALTIKELKFATTDPMPTANADLGDFVFEDRSGGKLNASITAKLSIDANGKIAASGSTTDSTGASSPINFSEDKPTGDSVASN